MPFVFSLYKRMRKVAVNRGLTMSLFGSCSVFVCGSTRVYRSHDDPQLEKPKFKTESVIRVGRCAYRIRNEVKKENLKKNNPTIVAAYHAAVAKCS